MGKGAYYKLENLNKELCRGEVGGDHRYVTFLTLIRSMLYCRDGFPESKSTRII